MKKIKLLTLLLVLQIACLNFEQETAAQTLSPQNSPTADMFLRGAEFKKASVSAKTANKRGQTKTKIVKFGKGENSITYEESLTKGGLYKFVVNARKNQVLALRVGTDSGSVTFNVSHKGKTIPTSVNTEKWTHKLNSGGDYQINVKRKSGSGKFLIEITVE